MIYIACFILPLIVGFFLKKNFLSFSITLLILSVIVSSSIIDIYKSHVKSQYPLIDIEDIVIEQKEARGLNTIYGQKILKIEEISRLRLAIFVPINEEKTIYTIYYDNENHDTIDRYKIDPNIEHPYVETHYIKFNHNFDKMFFYNNKFIKMESIVYIQTEEQICRIKSSYGAMTYVEGENK